jgi:Lrp/AsnC family transcriptional regulator, regulator for asnA, asnC and gidA
LDTARQDSNPDISTQKASFGLEISSEYSNWLRIRLLKAQTAGKIHICQEPVGPWSRGLDELSKLIVEQLQQDGRKSYAEIGKAVGLSEAAVRQRVQKLTDKGVMQIVAVTDPMQLGFYTQAMIGIRCNGDTTNLADELSKLPEVDYVVITAGSFDILAEVVCENDDSLINLLNNKIRKFDGVTSTETFVYLKLQKQLYNWGTR